MFSVVLTEPLSAISLRLVINVALDTKASLHFFFRDPTTTASFKKLAVLLSGNAGLRSHFPAQFEPTEDRGERRVEGEEEQEEEGRGEEDGRMAERPEEQQAGASVEAQIGRKLREIGDKFQQDHVELVSGSVGRFSTESV